MPSVPSVFLDVVIKSNSGSLYLTGRSIDLPDRTELFVIQASVSTGTPRGVDSDTRTLVPNFDLLKYWYSRSSSSVWTRCRLAKMYFDQAAMGIECPICDGGSAQPTPPNSPLQFQLHDKIPMTISVGSETSGAGLPVYTTDQERYIDHGDHNP